MKNISIVILFVLVLSGHACAWAQDEATMRSYVRSGNAHFRDSLFVDAEMDYRRALSINETDTVALFNLANALIMQQDQAKVAEADSLLQIIIKKAEQEGKRNLASQCFYQHGEIAMLAQQYDQAASAFKESLKRNPMDNDARFNYLLAKKLMEQQQNQNQNQDQQQQQNQEQQQQNQEQQQQEQQENQDQQQNQNQNQDQQQQDQQQMSQDQLQSILEQNEREEKETQAKVMRRQQEKDDKTKKEMEMRRRNGSLKDW